MNLDEIIKNRLRQTMGRMEDSEFSEKVIKIHSDRIRNSNLKPFHNFGELIVGLISVLLSLGFILSNSISKIEIAIQNERPNGGIIALLISLLFLAYKSFDEFLVNQPKKISREQTVRSN